MGIEVSNLYVILSSDFEPTQPVARTFLDAVRAGEAKLIDIDEWVERWHFSCGAAFGLELREYLGFSKEVYGAWVRSGPDALLGLV